jgi:hydrogenase maturation protease
MDVLILGIGNDDRGDDAVGRIIARRLKEHRLDRCTVFEQNGDGSMLMEAWNGRDTVILVDAVSSGTAPGTVCRFEAHVQPVPAFLFRRSTHAFGPAEAIELARAMNRLPPRLIMYGIEGKSFDLGAGLSLEAEKAVQRVVDRVIQDVLEAVI